MDVIGCHFSLIGSQLSWCLLGLIVHASAVAAGNR